MDAPYSPSSIAPGLLKDAFHVSNDCKPFIIEVSQPHEQLEIRDISKIKFSLTIPLLDNQGSWPFAKKVAFSMFGIGTPQNHPPAEMLGYSKWQAMMVAQILLIS